MMLRPDDPCQMAFGCRADWVAEEPLVTTVEQVVDGLDLGVLYDRYSEGGRPFYDPSMMLKVLFFAYCEGVRSSRRIASRIRYDIRYRYYTGQLCPDFRTINRFRLDNLDLLGDYFAQIVTLCEQSGVLDVSVLAIDSTKIRASASGRRAARQQKLDKLAARYRQELSRDAAGDDSSGESSEEDDIDKGDNSPSSSSGSLVADPDARFMKTSEGGRRLSYNSHIAVDKGQIIVAAEVSNCADDSVQFQSMLDSSRQHVTGELGSVLADGGYYSGRNIRDAVQSGIDLYLPVSNSGRVPDERFHRDAFVYDRSTDSYLCPKGKRLRYRGSRRRKNANKRIYSGSASNCGCCCVRLRCTAGRYRTLEISEHYRYERQMKAKLASDHGREVYGQRMPLVEAVFGNLKFNLGFGRYRLRGLKKVQGEFLLMCISHNLKKLAKYLSHTPPLARAYSAVQSALQALWNLYQRFLETLCPNPDHRRLRCRIATK